MQTILLKEKTFTFKGEVMWEKYKDGELVESTPWQPNKILTSADRGIQILLNLLAGDDTYTGEITHAEIGDDNTAVNASTDPGCLNPLERASLGLVSTSGLSRTFRFFFPDALTTDDTYTEFSMIIDGTGTIGTGRGFNRIVMSTPLVKAPGEDHTLVCRITGAVV